MLTVVDDCTRECPAIEVDTSLGGLRVRRVLDRIASERGLPEAIVLDNGPEFRGRVLAAWSEERGVRLEFIQPGKPVQNAYASHCTSFERCDTTEAKAWRRYRLTPWAFLGISRPTGSYRCSGLSV